MNKQNYFRYWGKAKSENQTADYHLLVFHSLDVAAVGRLLLEQNTFGTDKTIARLTDDKAGFIDWFTYALVLHDIGKFASTFQNLVQFETDALVNTSTGFGYSVRHDSLGYAIWCEKLQQHIEDRYSDEYFDTALDILLNIVTGHHGKPPVLDASANRIGLAFTEQDVQAVKDFADDLTFLHQDKIHPMLIDDDIEGVLLPFSWMLSGIATIADWLGSDQGVFCYQQTPMPLEQYYQQVAMPCAQKILQKIGYHQQVKIKQYTSIENLCEDIKVPTPLQHYCAEIKLDNGPQLFLLEDITGSGKTEAAMILAQRLLSHNDGTQSEGQGIYIALPTMATSNAMFERMAEIYRKFFTDDKQPSLVLAHGARHLSDKFSDMVQLTEQGKDRHYLADEQTASGWCNHWFVDNRKKSLLADVGVGTVDQALLAVLPTKHQSMRLLGLANKVLLIDEIHSYAEYEGELIQSLIKFHTCLGGTTILLSATMSATLRQSLVQAYYEGLGLPEPTIDAQAQFPWVTQCGPAIGLNEQVIKPRPAVVRSVNVDYQSDETDIWQLIEDSLRQGKSVCWIKNTVDETIACYHEAKERFIDSAKGITLFHSRFCMNDRIDIEKDVLARFGKDSGQECRRGQLLISSPILDQSLDVDISVMISDIAPIDVLIQRLGRCCRHLRLADENRIENPQPQDKDGRGQATITLYGPKFMAEPNENWLRTNFAGTQAVYRDPSIIWRTVKILQQEQVITMPNSARLLIEAVYGEDTNADISQGLQKLHDKVLGDIKADSQMARLNQLDYEQGYRTESNSQLWCDESNIPTRLAADNADFILYVVVGGQLRFFAETDKHPVDMNKLSLYCYYLTECSPQLVAPYQQQLTALIEQYRQLKYTKPLIFTLDDNGEYCSEGLLEVKNNDDTIKETKTVELRYDNKMGLRKISQT